MPLFEQKAPGIMALMMSDFAPLDLLGSAAFLGNFGEESGGFTALQEQNPRSGIGGWGWAQWTGPRRTAFTQYCQRAGFDLASDKANYGWLFVELKGAYGSVLDIVRAAPTLEDKVAAVMNHYEMPYAPDAHLDVRIDYAKRAIAAYNAAPQPVIPLFGSPPPATGSTQGPPPMPNPQNPGVPGGAPPSPPVDPTPLPDPKPPVPTPAPVMSIQAIIDGLDNAVDVARVFPVIGTIAAEIAVFLDPLRKAVDGGELATIRAKIDELDAQVDAWAKIPVVGTYLAPLSGMFDTFRSLIDSAIPAA